MAATPLSHGGTFTRADLERTPDAGRRHEIIGGPPPRVTVEPADVVR